MKAGEVIIFENLKNIDVAISICEAPGFDHLVEFWDGTVEHLLVLREKAMRLGVPIITSKQKDKTI
jgi:hypothetical protein